MLHSKPLILAAVFALVIVNVVRGVELTRWDNFSDEQIVKAIYQAEGASRATFAYGIRSIKYSTISEARRICFNSVRNGRKRWIKAGCPYDLITFIGLRYCPPTAHKLNSNWISNVKYFLAKK